MSGQVSERSLYNINMTNYREDVHDSNLEACRQISDDTLSDIYET